MSQAATDQDASLLLTVFSFGEALFALDAMRVQEIIRAGAITPVHRAPEHVLGIINLRGRIVTVMDPAVRIGLGAQSPGASSRILIVDWQDEHVGLLVSRIQDMVSLDRSALQGAPSNLRQALGAFQAGVVQIQEQMVSVLDIGPLLSLDDKA